jgi:beta-phosphoglucomutase-like phosphatase (HAD superfamily)
LRQRAGVRIASRPSLPTGNIWGVPTSTTLRVDGRVEEADLPSAPKFVLGVDLDGVCVDFYGAMREVAAEWLGVDAEQLTEDVRYGLPEWNLDPTGGYKSLHRFAVTQRRLFAQAPPIEGAPAALRRLDANDDIRIRIITNRLFIPHFHKEAAMQTIEWLDYHGIPYWDLCLLPDKAAVGAHLYIDDTPDNIEALRAKGFDAICFANSTNRDVLDPRANDWDELERMILERLAGWRQTPEAEIGPAGR